MASHLRDCYTGSLHYKKIAIKISRSIKRNVLVSHLVSKHTKLKLYPFLYMGIKVSHPKGRIQIESVWELGAKENT
jgi:hypothetical protein